MDEDRGVPNSTTSNQHKKVIRKITDDAPKNSQSDRFKQAAKDVGADESEAAFEEKLRRIAKTQPKKEKPAE